MLISEDLRDSLCQQYSNEKYNANFYLYLTGFLRNKGLNGLADIFDKQHDEEIEHSKLIFNFLADMNVNFVSYEIGKIDFPITIINDLAQKYLDLEIKTTKDLEEIKQLCIDENSGVAEEFLRQMVDRQRSELKEALDFLDNVNLCGNDWWKIKVWSDSLGSD
jgi:ferritin